MIKLGNKVYCKCDAQTFGVFNSLLYKISFSPGADEHTTFPRWVVFNHVTNEVLEDIIKYCKENVSGLYAIMPFTIGFTDEQDAMMFILAW